MKYREFSDFLDGDTARIVFLSTYQFDPEFFEARLLCCPSLARARRIVVFVDAAEWYKDMHTGASGRLINRRYLVVPVLWKPGVFHPKLSLLLTEASGSVLCGSNNLTRAGCTSNLEVLNVVPFSYEAVDEQALSVARQAYAFFKEIFRYTDSAVRSIVEQWVTETGNEFPWLNETGTNADSQIRLIHTVNGGIWDTISDIISAKVVHEFLVISPFHDSDCALLKKLANQYPEAMIEILVQQGVSTLPRSVGDTSPRVRLSELAGSSRRLHAKVFAWRNDNGWSCLTGSSNFTSAAFNGRNVETALVIENADVLIDALFDEELQKRSLSISDYEPASDENDVPDVETGIVLRLTTAVLTNDGSLILNFYHTFDSPQQSLRVELRTLGEELPRVTEQVSLTNQSTARLKLTAPLVSESPGAILAEIVAQRDHEEIRSLPVWVIDESSLTYEAGESGSSGTKKIQETGAGLIAHLDELYQRDGYLAVVDYLGHLTIRFDEGPRSAVPVRRFRVSLNDPHRGDAFPDWQIDGNVDASMLETAISEFVSRHEKQRLLKHARNGNINGMQNYLDILRTLVQLMYVWYQRQFFKGPKLVGRLCDFIELSLTGSDRDSNTKPGYLGSIAHNLKDGSDILRVHCNDLGYLAEIRALVLLAQFVRFRNEHSGSLDETTLRPKNYLPSLVATVEQSIKTLGLQEPQHDAVRDALSSFGVDDAEQVRLLMEALSS